MVGKHADFAPLKVDLLLSFTVGHVRNKVRVVAPSRQIILFLDSSHRNQRFRTLRCNFHPRELQESFRNLCILVERIARDLYQAELLSYLELAIVFFKLIFAGICKHPGVLLDEAQSQIYITLHLSILLSVPRLEDEQTLSIVKVT